MSHPRKGLDALIHSPVRFSILAALANVESADTESRISSIVSEKKPISNPRRSASRIQWAISWLLSRAS